VKRRRFLGLLIATPIVVTGRKAWGKSTSNGNPPPPTTSDLPVFFDRDLHIAIDRKAKTLWVSQSLADGEGGTYEYTYASYPCNTGKPGYETPSSANEPEGVFEAFDIRDYGQEAVDYGRVKSAWIQLGTGKVIQYGDPRFPFYSGIISFDEDSKGVAAIHDIANGTLNFSGESANTGSHGCVRMRRADFRALLGCARKIALSGFRVLVKVI
jgi:hypothetical protein